MSGNAPTTVSHNLQCGYVLQIVRVKQLRSTMIRYSFQEQVEIMFVYGQAGGNTVERQHECTEPHTLTGSTTHVTQHLEPFVWPWVPWRPLWTSAATWMGFRLCTVRQDSLFDVVLQCHLLWKLCISDTRWYELLCSIYSPESLPQVCRCSPCRAQFFL